MDARRVKSLQRRRPLRKVSSELDPFFVIRGCLDANHMQATMSVANGRVEIGARRFQPIRLDREQPAPELG